MAERLFVRILVAAALCIALLAFALVPIPVDATGDADFPAAALGQAALYRLEVALLVFYSSLLLVAIGLLEKTTDNLEQQLIETNLEIKRLDESLEVTVSNRR